MAAAKVRQGDSREEILELCNNHRVVIGCAPPLFYHRFCLVDFSVKEAKSSLSASCFLN